MGSRETVGVIGVAIVTEDEVAEEEDDVVAWLEDDEVLAGTVEEPVPLIVKLDD